MSNSSSKGSTGSVYSPLENMEETLGSQVVSELDLEQKDLDALYARDMNKLTLDERDKALYDIHGIATAIQENPEFVQQKRSGLVAALEALTRKKSEIAYQEAMRQDPTFVTSESFQLMFLRADQWDVKISAKKIFHFFHAKLDLFGADLLTQRLRIQHLSKEDRTSLNSGFFQLLPSRDVAGRSIICGLPMLRKYRDLKNLARSFFYLIMVTLEDPETQMNGFVFVGHNAGKNRVVDRGAVWVIQKLIRALPMRIGGIHFCYDDFKLRPMISVAMLLMGAHRRVRFRAHYGATNQQQYKLATFGIPQSVLPITEDGEPKTKFHRAWLKSRQQQEERFQSQLIIVVPNRLDVLLGRGKPIQEHIGNLRYHALLCNKQSAYEAARKFDKMEIAKQIVDEVHSYSGRFLKQEGAGWTIVDDTVARGKVSHAFRTRRAAGKVVNTTT